MNATRSDRARRAAEHPEIRAALVEIAFRSVTPVLAAALMLTGVGTFLAIASGDAVIAVLVGAVIVASSIRIVVVLAYRRRNAAVRNTLRDVVRWERWFAVGSLLFSGALGALCLKAIVLGGDTIDLIVVAMTYGYGAGVVSRLAARPWICGATLLVGVTPTLLGLAMQGTVEAMIATGVLALVLAAGIDTIRFNFRMQLGNLMAQRELARLASHDGLTGLPNRLAFEGHLAACLCDTAGGHVALLFVDLDGFKAVNDRHGHMAGDDVLREAARRIANAISATDFAARLGGDEFVVVRSRLRDPEAADILGRCLARALAAPTRVEKVTVAVGASVGVAIAPRDGDTPASLLAAADAAVYRAKGRRLAGPGAARAS